jgi:DNA-binding response OmpR family regulator
MKSIRTLSLLVPLKKMTQISLNLVENIRRSGKTIPIIFITEQSSEQLAIAALGPV